MLRLLGVRQEKGSVAEAPVSKTSNEAFPSSVRSRLRFPKSLDTPDFEVIGLNHQNT